MASRKRDPRTKEEFLDRMLSFDFDGDIRHLGVEDATIQRLGPNALRLKFPESDQVFDLTIHKPREFAKVKAAPRTFTRDTTTTLTELTETHDEPVKRTRAHSKDAGQPRTRRERQAPSA